MVAPLITGGHPKTLRDLNIFSYEDEGEGSVGAGRAEVGLARKEDLSNPQFISTSAQPSTPWLT